jgi:hypothetical protein
MFLSATCLSLPPCFVESFGRSHKREANDPCKNCGPRTCYGNCNDGDDTIDHQPPVFARILSRTGVDLLLVVLGRYKWQNHQWSETRSPEVCSKRSCAQNHQQSNLESLLRSSGSYCQRPAICWAFRCHNSFSMHQMVSQAMCGHLGHPYSFPLTDDWVLILSLRRIRCLEHGQACNLYVWRSLPAVRPCLCPTTVDSKACS